MASAAGQERCSPPPRQANNRRSGAASSMDRPTRGTMPVSMQVALRLQEIHYQFDGEVGCL